MENIFCSRVYFCSVWFTSSLTYCTGNKYTVLNCFNAKLFEIHSETELHVVLQSEFLMIQSVANTTQRSTLHSNEASLLIHSIHSHRKDPLDAIFKK